MIDITLPLRHGMAHYPGDPLITFARISSLSGGDAVNLSQYCFGSHSGTHIDAPYHFFEDGATVDKLPADLLVGRARVVALAGDIARTDIEGEPIARGEIVLFKTVDGVQDCGEVSLLPCAAAFLRDAGVRVVGIDRLSIETDAAFPAHRILLGAGIPILEGLNLSEAAAGVYKMTGMVMRVAGGDGAPVRAILE